MTLVSFEGIAWYREGGRIRLRDEAAAREALGKGDRPIGERAALCEAAATTYRRLTSNFERTRQTDLAEDCFWGTMEMKRLNPEETRISKIALRAYFTASAYGSSYARALAILFGIVILFGVLFAALPADVQPNPDWAPKGRPSIPQEFSVARPFLWGLFHSVEVSTFARNTRYVAASALGQFLRILETVLVAGQLALFLLALRRRFKR